jgi:hypothetical protein
MRTLIIACGLSFGLIGFAATDASACGWSSKSASTTSPSQTVMAPQTQTPKPSSDG